MMYIHTYIHAYIHTTTTPSGPQRAQATELIYHAATLLVGVYHHRSLHLISFTFCILLYFSLFLLFFIAGLCTSPQESAPDIIFIFFFMLVCVRRHRSLHMICLH